MSNACTLSVYYHTHWDREWYQPFRQYQIRLAEVIDCVLGDLESGRYACFTLDGQTCLLDDYLELRPQNRDRLESLIQAGKIAIGPWYVMPDEFLVNGESLIRNLQRGIQTAKSYGYTTFTGYLPDTFGHSTDIPTLFRLFQIETAIVWRGVNPQNAEFLWQSRTGDTVLTLHLSDGYFQNGLHDPHLSLESRKDYLQKLQQTLLDHSATGAVLMPLGADHLGQLPDEGFSVLNALFPNRIETTPDRFMAELSERVSRVSQPLQQIQGDLLDNTTTFVLPGVYSARVYLKQANRKLEHRLTRQIEQLLAWQACWQEGKVPLRELSMQPQSYQPAFPQAEVALAWKLLLLNHPHDSICGCSIDSVHRDNEVRFDAVNAICDSLYHQQIHWMSLLAGQDQWLIYNLGDTPYTGVVPARQLCMEAFQPSDLHQLSGTRTVLQEDYLTDTADLPQAHRTVTEHVGYLWVESIPCHGFQVISKGQNSIPDDLKASASANRLQNSFYTVSVAPGTGEITVIDLQRNQTYPNLCRLIDQAEQGDSYNGASVPGTQEQEATLVKTTVLAAGPLVAQLRLDYTVPAPETVPADLPWSLQTTITLQAGSPLITFQTEFTNLYPDHKLQVCFTTGMPVQTIQAETHFGVEERHYSPDFSPEAAMPVAPFRELPLTTGAIQRFLSANGQTFITQGLCEYEAHRHELRLTLLRAFGFLSKGDTGVRGAQAGPPLETPEGQCLNRPLVCEYAWMPTPENTYECYQQAERYYGSAWGIEGRAQAPASARCSLLHWENPHIVSTAFQWLCAQEHSKSGLLVRLLNTSAETQTLTFNLAIPCQGIHQLNGLNEPIASLEEPICTLKPYGIETVLFQVE